MSRVVCLGSLFVISLSEPMGPILVGHVSFPGFAFGNLVPAFDPGRDVCSRGH